jgi:hypothetical protein
MHKIVIGGLGIAINRDDDANGRAVFCYYSRHLPSDWDSDPRTVKMPVLQT